MTRPIGMRHDAPQLPMALPGHNASPEVHAAFSQSLAALGKHERYQHLQPMFVNAARNGDRETISQLNPMLDGRDAHLLCEALTAAAANGHFEIMRSIIENRAWLWALNKFEIMTSIVEHYDPSKLAQRRAFMDLFSGLPGERRIVGMFGDASVFENRLAELLSKVRRRDTELFDWCRAELATERTAEWQ